MIREEKYVALFERLESALTDYAPTRDLISVADVQEWPTFSLVSGDHIAMQGEDTDKPTRWQLEAVLALFIDREPAEPFETSIHQEIDRVVAALAPRAGEASFGSSYHTTLGDEVERAWVQGAVRIYREPGDQRAVVEIPIEMFTV